VAFSEQTRNAAQPIADRFKANYEAVYGPLPKGMDPITIVLAILGAIMAACKPKTQAARAALVKKWARAFSENGVAGCCDKLTPKAKKRLDKKLAKAKLKTVQLKDRALFLVAQAAVHEEDCCHVAMESAVDNDESDDDEDT
jgi:hypothetical protein